LRMTMALRMASSSCVIKHLRSYCEDVFILGIAKSEKIRVELLHRWNSGLVQRRFNLQAVKLA